MADILLTREPGKVPGYKVELGAQGYIIPPLNIAGHEEHADNIEKVQTDKSLKTQQKLNLICAIILTALQRNYPELTLEFVKKWVDLSNVRPIFNAVMSISGFTEVAPGEITRDGSTGATSKPA